jgi:uncharacterized protein
MTDSIRRVSASAARRFLVRRHLLAPPRSLPAGVAGVRAAFAVLGSVQFDPLGVAGRNHDLVLHARVAGYRSAWTDTLLYDTRELYETFNKGLSLLPTAELPWYRLAWDRSGLQEHSTIMQQVLAQIRERGPQSSGDFERLMADSTDWFGRPANEMRLALEALWEAGVLGLARREGNRRFYDLAERIYPPALMAERHSPREQRLHKLLSRYRAHGLLGTGGQTELWLGTAPARPDPKDPSRYSLQELRPELVSAGAIVPVEVEGVRGPRFVIGKDLAALDAAMAEADSAAVGGPSGPSVTFLAPLDPLAWDRGLMRQLFNFDYVWEVYVPEAKRRWGYYVLPLLFGDRLVGRIEPRIDRGAGVVRIVGAWWEAGFDPRKADGFIDAMRRALVNYLDFGGARSVEWSPGLNREKRLIGTRPRKTA